MPAGVAMGEVGLPAGVCQLDARRGAPLPLRASTAPAVVAATPGCSARVALAVAKGEAQSLSGGCQLKDRNGAGIRMRLRRDAWPCLDAGFAAAAAENGEGRSLLPACDGAALPEACCTCAAGRCEAVVSLPERPPAPPDLPAGPCTVSCSDSCGGVKGASWPVCCGRRAGGRRRSVSSSSDAVGRSSMSSEVQRW